MSALSDYLENKIMDHFTGKTTFASPSIYSALFSTSPTDSASGEEVGTGAYARILSASWDTSASGATENSSAITFPQATASYNVVAVALMDGSTVGCATNILWYGRLTTSRLVNQNDTFEIAASSLDLTID